MAWTYGGDPSANNRDAVRFLIGDTVTADQKLSDSEIAYLLSAHSDNVFFSAAAACEAIASFYATALSKSVGSTSVSLGEKHSNYLTLAERLRNQVRQTPVAIYSGGATEDDKDTYREDDDIIQPFFSREMDDNEGETQTFHRSP